MIALFGANAWGGIKWLVDKIWGAIRWFHNLDVWWIEGIVVAVVIGVLINHLQKQIDDDRSLREQRAAEVLSSKSERLENLRFVRDRSSMTYLERPFANLDLQNQNLGGLNLQGADLTGARLVGAQFRLTQLEVGLEYPHDGTPPSRYDNPYGRVTSLRAVAACGADFTGARLGGSNLSMGNFQDADFTLANMVGADLRGANFSGATLEPRNFDAEWRSSNPAAPPTVNGAIYDDTTIWPTKDFKQPPLYRPYAPTSYDYGEAYRRTLTRPDC